MTMNTARRTGPDNGGLDTQDLLDCSEDKFLLPVAETRVNTFAGNPLKLV